MTDPAAAPDTPPLPRYGQWLRRQREARGWNIPQMRTHLRQAAKNKGDTLPGNEYLGVMIRRWENDDSGGMSNRYRIHYSTALGTDPAQFGTAPVPVSPPGPGHHLADGQDR